MSKVRQIKRNVAKAVPAPEAAPAAPEAAALTAPAGRAAMSKQIAINNIVSVVRAFSCNADDRDLLQQSLETIVEGLNQTEAAFARVQELVAEVAALKGETAPEA